MGQIFYYPERWDVNASQEEVRNLLLLSSRVFPPPRPHLLFFLVLFIYYPGMCQRGTRLSLFSVTPYKCKSVAGLWFIMSP